MIQVTYRPSHAIRPMHDQRALLPIPIPTPLDVEPFQGQILANGLFLSSLWTIS
jgi:hypothetical protein